MVLLMMWTAAMVVVVGWCGCDSNSADYEGERDRSRDFTDPG